MPPSAPQDLNISSDEISFSRPLYTGGGNIQNYEVFAPIKVLTIICYIQVHIQEQGSAIWYWLCDIPVKSLSTAPDIPGNILAGLGGAIILRVCARNLAGRGICSEQLPVVLNGV